MLKAEKKKKNLAPPPKGFEGKGNSLSLPNQVFLGLQSKKVWWKEVKPR